MVAVLSNLTAFSSALHLSRLLANAKAGSREMPAPKSATNRILQHNFVQVVQFLSSLRMVCFGEYNHWFFAIMFVLVMCVLGRLQRTEWAAGSQRWWLLHWHWWSSTMCWSTATNLPVHLWLPKKRDYQKVRKISNCSKSWKINFRCAEE